MCVVGPIDTSKCWPGVCDFLFFFLIVKRDSCDRFTHSFWCASTQLILTPVYPNVKAALLTTDNKFNLYLASIL